MRLPTTREINPIPENLEGQSAEEHFHGKSLEEAEALFCENSLYYQEDLMFMGAPAFCFYVQAAISYIQSAAATEDSDIVNSLASILDHRLQFEAKELIGVAAQLASVCRYILEHYDRFALTPDIYGDLRPRFQALEQTFLKQVHA